MPELAVIEIEVTPGGVRIEGSGTFEPGSHTLAERLSIAALKAVSAEMKKVGKEQEAMGGGYHTPVVKGDKRIIDQTELADDAAYDVQPIAPPPPDTHHWE